MVAPPDVRPGSPAASCPFTRAVELVRDPCTFLVLREAVVHNASRLEEFLLIPGMDAGILESRLDVLLRFGVLRREPDGSPDYRLTPEGMRLVIILRALGDWGERLTSSPAGPEHPV